jgi:tRNA(fMet)-specific endonuclease VapC
LAYLIDTNIAIHARDGNAAVFARFARHQGAVVLSALSLVELQRGLYKDAAYTAIRRTKLEVVLRNIPVIAFDSAAAEVYGRIIGALGWVKGRDFDRMIAAHAIAARAILVTANATDFRDIPGLEIEDWTLAP